ncbi:putative peptidyl-alpha-hydroxyglycine alpha-amidating lyase pgal-1 isoform X2 [Convolutriloba macropyga]|uniref:putative peptidyl-alpha-hydroxyglycine alpha-amidating lyase pgal-1 isoform X2 n=1 Tax=Convolutriloba macropyga TaxID=536237 RepID=UPI003F522576
MNKVIKIVLCVFVSGLQLTNAYVVSEFGYYGTQRISREITINSFETRGTNREFIYCKGSKVSSPFHINDIVQHPVPRQRGKGAEAEEDVNIIAAIHVFTCSEITTDKLVECNTKDKFESLCKGSGLAAVWTPDMVESGVNRVQQPDTLFTANAIILRVVYDDVTPVITPAVGVEVTEEESVGDQGHFLDRSADHNKLFGLKSIQHGLLSIPQPIIERDNSWHLTWSEGKIGQASGVAVLDQDYVIVFHRAERSWTGSTFKDLKMQNMTKIDSDTLLKCRIRDGECTSSMGKDMFLLPHGISVTPDNNFLLLTDVGRHQVFALSIETGEVTLTLGTFGVPKQGDYPDYFCQPADAEMDPETGLIFVADGYCNSRVAIFNNDGSYNTSIKGCVKDDDFRIVHDLAIDAENRVLFVADRENGRICIFSIDVGHKFGEALDLIETGQSTVYALDYNMGNLYSAEWGARGSAHKAFGTIIPTTTGKTEQVEQFYDSHMRDPHDISVWENTYIFMSDLKSPSKVFKFIRMD